MKNYTGWFFDLYAHPRKGVEIWLIGEDGKSYSFYQDFEMVFYIGGKIPRLRQVWSFLGDKKDVRLSYTERNDLFAGPQKVVKVQVKSPVIYPELFRETYNKFPDLIYYDADIPLNLRFAAIHNVFPLARCQVTAKADGKIVKIKSLDTPWKIDPVPPVLRKLRIRPDIDPFHAQPKNLLVNYGKFKYRIPLDKPRDLLFKINAIFRQYNPDVILTSCGDTWLFSYLEEISKQARIPFNPNRDTSQQVLRRDEVSFFNYGQAHYRGEQVHLLGRWHIDDKNCMTYKDYGLAGAIEQARVTGLPVQEIARRSAGAGIAAMQNLTALRRGVLIPYQHQKGEVTKTYDQLFKADRGGLIFEPELGVFPNVAVLDFTMMFPSIMVKYNISPETVGADEEDALEVPELGIKISRRLGLVPETLKPLVNKRVKIKKRLKTLEKINPKYRVYKALDKGLKWLGVVSYGRLGFANATFGRINAHEVVGYFGRRALLQAKGVAENQGFTFLHGYVDSVMIRRDHASKAKDFQCVVREIEKVTGLPIDLEDVYKWMAFVASITKANKPVSNRFFGLKQDGTYKIRGLAMRRRDTTKFVYKAQMEALNILAQESDHTKLVNLIPEIIAKMHRRIAALEKRQIPLKALVVTRTLSRELSEYRVSSAVVMTGLQLKEAGKDVRMGQPVRFIYTKGKPGVFAWDLPASLDPKAINIAQYKKLLLKAIYEVLQPLGVTENILRNWLFKQGGYITPEGFLDPSKRGIKLELPIFAGFDANRLERL